MMVGEIDGDSLDTELFVHEPDDQETAHTVESDITHSTPTRPTTERVPRGPVEVEDGAGSPSFDALRDLDEADVETTEEMIRGLTSGRIRAVESYDPAPDTIAEAPADPVADPVTPAKAIAPVEETETEEVKAKKARARFIDEDDIAVIRIAKEKGIKLTEAVRLLERERANAIDDLVEVDEPVAKATAPPADPAAGLPFATKAEAEQRIYQLERDAIDADFKEFDAEKAYNLRVEAMELRAQLPQIAQAEAESRTKREQEAAQDYEARWQASETRAQRLFPELTQPGSPLLAEMGRIDAEIKASNPTLWHSPDKYLELALMARERLGSTPSSVVSTPAPSTVLPTTPRNPVARGVSASPMARATTPSPAQPRIAEEIDALATADDLAELDARLGFR